MTGPITELTDATFDPFVTQKGLTLVDGWAPWCPPCHKLAPVLDELAAELPDVRFAKLNTDENPTITQRFGIMSLPTLLLFKDGEPVDRIIGAQPKGQLAAALARHR